jgi:hypothetical protein
MARLMIDLGLWFTPPNANVHQAKVRALTEDGWQNEIDEKINVFILVVTISSYVMGY